MEITTLEDLQAFYRSLPDGSLSDGLSSDLEAGNFDHTSVELPDGQVIDVRYTGPIQEGYISPFER